MLLPGERLEITLTMEIDEAAAHDVFNGKDTVDDILVVRIENGRDLYITVSGNYLSTAFGTSLNHLVRNADPVRDTPRGEVGGGAGGRGAGGDQAAAQSLPKELWYVHVIIRVL